MKEHFAAQNVHYLLKSLYWSILKKERKYCLKSILHKLIEYVQLGVPKRVGPEARWIKVLGLVP
jgi:hypothetical protein